MVRKVPVLVMVLATAIAPAVAGAQERTARLVGYERADMVQGEIVLSPAAGTVLIRGFASSYGKPMELYLARGFDLSTSARIGEVPAEAGAGISFDLPAGDSSSADTVILTLEGHPAAVGVGLFK